MGTHHSFAWLFYANFTRTCYNKFGDNMNFSFFIKSIAYIILEFLYGYKLEKEKLYKIKYLYILSLLIIILEFIKI